MFCETSSRLYENVNFDISSLTSNSQISKAILRKLETNYGENYQNNLYKITLTGKFPDGFSPNSKAISLELMENVYYASVINSSVPDVDIKILASDFSLKGLFAKKMLAKIKSCESQTDKKIYENALYIGLKAFDGEVSFYED